MRVVLKIEGMTCSACSIGLEKALKRSSKIRDVKVSLITSEAFIECDDDLTIEKIEALIENAGFHSLGDARNFDLEKEKKRLKSQIKKFTILIVLASLLMFINMFFSIIPFYINHGIMFVLSLLFLIYGSDIIKNGVKNIINKIPNMDSLVAIGVLTSFCYSTFKYFLSFKYKFNDNMFYFDSVIMVIYFVKLGRYIDFISKMKAVKDISSLLQLTPKNVIKLEKNKEVLLSIDEVKKGDILISKPGDVIAVDGIIVKGEGYLDEALLTGEGVPVKKHVGSNVIAGTINYNGYLEYKAEKIGKNSCLSEIIRLVVDASNSKSRSLKIVDTICGYFVPIVISVAILTFIYYFLIGDISFAILSMVNVLVVSCPCSLGLATPLAMVVSIGYSAKLGILIKSNEVLENVEKVNTIVFDKTGTLTSGKLEIVDYKTREKQDYRKLLKIIASVEKNSNHPIAKSFVEYAISKDIDFFDTKEFTNIDGMGVSAKIDNDYIYLGNSRLLDYLKIENTYKEEEQLYKKNKDSIVYVIINNKLVAIIGLRDKIKENTHEVICKLKNMKKRVIMLTGDNDESARLIAKSLGIEEVISNVLPSEKSDKIKELQKMDANVMMVGDGINDAPALAVASVAISVNGAVDIASNVADVILLNNNLDSIFDLIKISKKALTNIKVNLFISFFYNIIMISIATGIFRTFGIKITPTIASISMILSSLTVTYNAIRLRKG